MYWGILAVDYDSIDRAPIFSQFRLSRLGYSVVYGTEAILGWLLKTRNTQLMTNQNAQIFLKTTLPYNSETY